MQIRQIFIKIILNVFLLGVFSIEEKDNNTKTEKEDFSLTQYWIFLLVGAAILIFICINCFCYFYFAEPKTPKPKRGYVLQFKERVGIMKERIFGEKNEFQLKQQQYQQFVQKDIQTTYYGSYEKNSGSIKRITYKLTFTTNGVVYGDCEDANKCSHIRGYYCLQYTHNNNNNNNFFAEWIESPEKIPLDPESKDLDLESVKKIVENPCYFAICRLSGESCGGELPEEIKGEYEVTTGLKGDVTIFKW